MSIEAYVWVTRHAPVPKPDSARLVLYALAEHADQSGRNAFPGKATLADYLGGNTQANRDKVKRALRVLERGGWIVRSYSPRVEALPEHKRPTVWALNLHLVREQPADEAPGVSSDPQEGGSAVTPGVSSDPGGGSVVTRGGVSSDPQTVSNPSINREGETTGQSSSPTSPESRTTDPTPSDIPQEWINDPRRAHCPQHQDGNADAPCRACGNARRAATEAKASRERASQQRRLHKQFEERERLAAEDQVAREAAAERPSWRALLERAKRIEEESAA